MRYALLAAWDAAALYYVATALASTLYFSAAETKSHALSENPGRASADILMLAASLASLLAVGWLLLQSGQVSGTERTINIALGLASVVVSWLVVHTLFMLNYARLYYGEPEGGIEFDGPDKPRYSDFAYLSFTIGMCYQVSDTGLQSSRLRAEALKQALLSYVFGVAIIAATINLVAGLMQ